MLTKPAAAMASKFIDDYALTNGIYMKINYVNPEHVHALIDLPTSKSIEETVKLLKGSSSHDINEQRLLRGRFSWGRVMGPSQYLIQTSVEWRHTSPIRKGITIRKRLVRSLSYL
jgi:REP element-mobilizing transposase RayT